MKSILGKNNPEIQTLTDNRFNTYLVLTSSDLNKAQVNKTLYRDSPYHETETLMGPNYLNLFKSNEHRKDNHIRKPSDNFFFEIEDKKGKLCGR